MRWHPNCGLAWFVAGGIFNTTGALVYLFDSRIQYAHLGLLLFVMAGSMRNIFAALWHSIASASPLRLRADLHSALQRHGAP